jgi:predicted PurR-regulated permease PerM
MEIEIITTQTTTSNVDPTREFGLCLLKTESIIHMVHWYVLNYDAHKILGNLYEDLDDLFDKLQEEIIGCSRSNTALFPTFNHSIFDNYLNNINNFSDQNGNIINIYFETYKEISSILTSIELNNYITQVKSGMHNTIEEILSRFNSANYLLGLVKD